MDEETLARAAGILLSLLFTYVPKFSDWYNKQSPQIKAAWMGGLLILVAAGAYGLSCTGYYAFFECSQPGLVAAFNVLVAALLANQGTYLITRYLPIRKPRVPAAQG